MSLVLASNAFASVKAKEDVFYVLFNGVRVYLLIAIVAKIELLAKTKDISKCVWVITSSAC